MIETLTPFADSYHATLLMALVCAYLGLFCVLRRIVFTGVALAQLAAAGVAAASFVAGQPALPLWLTEGAARHGATLGSLAAAALGTLALEARDATSRRRVSADVQVGVAYAAAAAVAVLLVWKSPHGLAELRDILAGEVLLARRGERAALYAGLLAVAALHLALRRRFLLVAFDPEFARALRLPVRRLELALMLSLAVAVALSLRAGGLLLVFSFLVLPATSGLLLGRRLAEATWLALAAGAGAALGGFLAAVGLDLPVAATIACCLLVHLAASAAATRCAPALARAARGVTYALGICALAAGLGLALVPAATPAPQVVEAAPGPHGERGAREPDAAEAAIAALGGGATTAERAQAARRLAGRVDAATLEALIAALGDLEPAVRQAAGAAIAAGGARAEARERLRTLATSGPSDRQVLAAVGLLRVGLAGGAGRLVDALTDPAAPILSRELALAELAALAGDTFGYEPFAAPETNAAAARRWQAWWTEHRGRLAWDPAAQRFDVR